MFQPASALLCLVLAAAPGRIPAPENDAPEPQAQVADAQQVRTEDAQDEKPPTPAHTGVRALFAGIAGDVEHLPSKENLRILGIGTVFTIAAHPLDGTLNTRFVNQYDVVNAIFDPGKYYGDTPEQLILSIGTWTLGRALHKPRMAHLGVDLLRAQALTEIMIEPIKLATGRERPDGSNSQSFPSGHAAITFAAAAVIERHLGWKNSVIAFAIASYVAASRLHDNRHYLSDVVFGATIGSIAGRTVTRHGRNTWTFGPMAVPGGVAISATRTGF